jgi:tryptophanyl-tRNA synthetase
LPNRKDFIAYISVRYSKIRRWSCSSSSSRSSSQRIRIVTMPSLVTFTVPRPHIVRETAKIYDLQDPSAKMSKSSSSPKGIVNLLDPAKVTAKKIRSAVTDTGTEIRFDPEHKPGVSNLLTIYSALTGISVTALEEKFAGQLYGALKTELADVVIDWVTPFQRRTGCAVRVRYADSSEEMLRLLTSEDPSA